MSEMLCGLALAVLGALCVLWLVRAFHHFLCRTRHTLFDFILLVWSTSLVMGLIARLFPEDEPLGAVLAVAGFCGAFFLLGGVTGLQIANRLHLEHHGPRALLLFRGMLGALFVPALGYLPVITLYLLRDWASWREEGLALQVAACASVVAAAAVIWHGFRFLRLDRRTRQAEEFAVAPDDRPGPEEQSATGKSPDDEP